MNCKLYGKEGTWHILVYCCVILLEYQMKITKNVRINGLWIEV
jgi:hypothetical protein